MCGRETAVSAVSDPEKKAERSKSTKIAPIVIQISVSIMGKRRHVGCF